MSPKSYLLLLWFLTGATTGLAISATQTAVLGYENGTVLLNVSYHLKEPTTWLQIRWEHVNKTGQLVICTITNEDGKKTVKQFPPDGYEKRMMVIPENGSLSIRQLKKEDGGVYRVSLLDTEHKKTAEIHVTVNDSRTRDSLDVFTQSHTSATENPQNCSCIGGDGVDVSTSAWVLFSSRLSTVLITFLVFFILHFRERRTQRHRMSHRMHKFR